MAAIELPRFDLFTLTRTLVRSKHFTGERLHRGSRQHARELRQMRTAVSAAQPRQSELAKILQQIEADQLRIIRLDRLALAGIGNRPRARFGGDDVELRIDRHRQPEIVHRFTDWPEPGSQDEVARLVVSQDCFDIP